MCTNKGKFGRHGAQLVNNRILRILSQSVVKRKVSVITFSANRLYIFFFRVQLVQQLFRYVRKGDASGRRKQRTVPLRKNKPPDVPPPGIFPHAGGLSARPREIDGYFLDLVLMAKKG